MPVSIRSQIERVRAEYSSLPTGLVRHVERVLVEALDLSRRWDVDPERAELATWGHDLFRSSKPTELLRMASEAGITLEEADRAEPVLLHGPIAAAVLEGRFGLTDGDALAAVRDHTLGLGEMPLLSKIILLADKFEARKRDRTPVMKEIRRLARTDMDCALLCWADWKWVDERSRGWLGHPQHWTARQRWVFEHHLDAALPPRTTEDTAAEE